MCVNTTLQLPSDIERIALTTIHEDSEGLSKTDTAGGDAIQLQLLVTRKVPLIGKLSVDISIVGTHNVSADIICGVSFIDHCNTRHRCVCCHVLSVCLHSLYTV
jgi:hypothetical protein